MRRRSVPVFRPRRRRSRLLVVAAGVLGLLIVGAAVLIGGGYWYLSGSLPEREGTVYLDGLNGEVRVYWDERGVPHIEAAHADDLFFAQGYVTAQDRLWQMDVYRRLAGGRLAEILGESELPQDMFFRTLGFRQAAEASIEVADAEALAMVEAYAAGVTAYMEHVIGDGLLPIEFRLLGYEPEPWTAIDTLLIARLMAYQLSGNWGDELDRYRIAETYGWDVLSEWLPDYPAIAPTITTWASMMPTEEPEADEQPGDEGRDDATVEDETRNDGTIGDEGQDDTSPASEAQADDSPGDEEQDNASPDGEAQAGESSDGEMQADDRPGGETQDDGGLGHAPLSAERAAALEALAQFAPGPHLGSNSWALAPDKTATGGALLANDPHMPISIPALWHQVHLVLEGDFPAMGIGIPGVPGIVFGRNDHIAWAITSLVADSQDLFIQRPNPENPREFLYKGQWVPAHVREEVIHVKGFSEPVIYEVLETAHHGPVLNPTLDHDVADVLSFKWTALGPTREINALLPLMRATNFDEFEAAVDVFDMPALSLLYADVDGNIGYKASGLLPIRPEGGGRVPVPAWTGEHDWLGTIPKSDMPRSYNPDSGFIVTANNLPVDGDYPYYLGDGFDPWRALRIADVLAHGDDFTVDDMQALQLDVTNVHAQHMLPMLTAAVEARMRGALQPDETESAALDMLKDWNYVEHAGGPEPFIWHSWLQELQRAVITQRVGFHIDDMLLLDDLLLAMSRTELAEVATRAFRAAVRRAVTAQGNDPNRWQWGRWHRLTVYHPVGESIAALGWLMNVGDWPMAGSFATPGVASADAETGLVNHGASWRAVIDLDSAVGRDILLPGNSGHILSPVYKDQADAWYAGQLYDQEWRPEQYRRGALLRLLPD